MGNISKQEFLSRLKNPHKSLIRRKIREVRKHIRSKGWTLYSSYDKHQNVFTLRFHCESGNFNTTGYSYSYKHYTNKSEIIRDIRGIFTSDFDIILGNVMVGADNQNIVLYVKGSRLPNNTAKP